VQGIVANPMPHPSPGQQAGREACVGKPLPSHGVVSVDNDPQNIQSTRFTSRAKLNRVFSFQGRTGRFCEVMLGRCDSDETK
jgi:hypothetical protein